MSDPIRAALERLVKASELVLRFDRWMPDLRDAIAAGKAALAEQQVGGPSDEDLLQVAIDTRLCRFQATAGDPVQYELTEAQINAYARAVLARWGRQPAPTDHRGVLPMIVSETGACDEPETERIICASISGGADYINNMPRTLTLERINSEGSTYQKYIQDPIRALADHPAPQPPADGEVGDGEIDAFIHHWWEAYGKGYLPNSSDKALVAAALARFSRPAPQPPAEGEVGELVAELYADAKEWRDLSEYSEGAKCHRAAELLQLQQAEIQKLWTWLLACEGTANARAGGSGKPKWPALPLPLPQGEVEP